MIKKEGIPAGYHRRKNMTYEQVKQDEAVRVYIDQADASLKALGFTEHSFQHVTRVAQTAGWILETLGYPERTVELVKIAGYLHDIGNVVNRVDHSQSGAVMAFRILDRMNFPPEEIAAIVTAIGNHDEGTGQPVSAFAAALILADKSDVRRSRVRDKATVALDIHDRVNFSIQQNSVTVDRKNHVIRHELVMDETSSVLEYTQIYTARIVMCEQAAAFLNCAFELVINGQTVNNRPPKTEK